jgi:hypothetical protein
MTDSDHGQRVAAPSGWQDWQRWVEDVDWSDWRSWLQRVASTDWASGPWPATPWEQAAPQGAPEGEVSLTFRAFEEDEPGKAIGEHLAATWPAFRRWWFGGANTRPTAVEAGARLKEHMPELVPVWQRLTALLGDDPEAAAALTLWNPPPFLTGCSQAAVLLDCLWGLLDGVNDAGLAVSLTFGGRPQVGEGFGIPLVIRYVLQTCQTTEEAMRVLRRIPVHMSYNVTALDRADRRATAYLAPDRPGHVTSLAVATNYQGKVEWAPYAAAIRTVERQQHLEELLAAGADVPGVVAACLRSPLYATRFHQGFGTLYTAEYRPAEGVARYHWPDRTWDHSLDQLGSGRTQVQLGRSQ